MLVYCVLTFQSPAPLERFILIGPCVIRFAITQRQGRMQDFDDGSPAIAQQPTGRHRQPLIAASPRRAPLPEAFGQVFGFWLKDQPRGEFVFARTAGQKPVSSQAARAYLRGMLNKAGIEKKITPHKLRHTYATNLLNAGAERVDIKALLGHESIATTQIYTNVGQARMEQVVARL